MANEEYNKTFLQSDTLEDAQAALQDVYEANPDAVIIVEEEGKECIIEHGKQMNFVPSTIDPAKLATLDDISGNTEEVYYVEADSDGNLRTSNEECAEIFEKLEENNNAKVVLKAGNTTLKPTSKHYGTIGIGAGYSFSYQDANEYYKLFLSDLSNFIIGGGTLNKGKLAADFGVGKGLENSGGVLNVTLDTTPFIVLDSLPDSPEEGNENKIHIVPSEKTEEGNKFVEWVYVNGEWEKFGEFKADVDMSNYLTSKQAAQKYYPKTDGEDLRLEVDEHDRAIGVIEQQIGNLSFRAVPKDDFDKLESKEPNTLYIVTK